MEQFRPVREGLVRSDDRAGLFISVSNEPEEQIALFPVYGGVPNFIHYDHGGLIIAPPFSGTPCLIILSQLLYQVLHVRKIDAYACLAGF